MSKTITPAAFSAAVSGNMHNFMVAITPGGIEAQEAAGQRSLVANENLPKEMLGCNREMLEKIGIKFGADIDDLFVKVQLPNGWKKQATDHSMWSDLIDEQGRKRASIFYKAAFYDRSAHISLYCRYIISRYDPCDIDGNPSNCGKHSHLKTVIKEGESAIHIVGIRERKTITQEKNTEKKPKNGCFRTSLIGKTLWRTGNKTKTLNPDTRY